MKKRFIFLLTICLALCLLSSCGGNGGDDKVNNDVECTTHEGGTATCASGPICTVCGKEYGEPDPSAHVLTGPWIVDSGYHYRECKNGCDISLLKEKCSFTPTCASAGRCSVCGIAGSELDPDNHKPADEWTTANGYHYHACENGCGKELDKASCDSEGTCAAPLPCKICGVDYIKPENHSLAEDWTVENGTHYKVCENGCGVPVYFGTCDITPTCTSAGKCSVCGTDGTAIDLDNHKPAAGWTVENGTHYKVCENGCGNQLYLGSCDITPTCNDVGKCSVCGTKGTSTDPTKHSFGTEYTVTDTMHYIACKNGCGTTKNDGEHSYEWVNAEVSTTTSRGKLEYKCECGKVLEERNSPAVIMPVKGGADSIFVLIHDDGTWDTVLLADELYYKYGLVGDAAMQLNNIFVKAGERYDLEDDTINTAGVEKWSKLFETGRWKAMSHSMTHKWWGTYDKDDDGTCSNLENKTELEIYEIVKSQALLRQYFPSQRVLTFAYPGFAEPKNYIEGVTSAVEKFNAVYNESARALLQKYYIAARSTQNALVDIGDPQGTWESSSATSGYASYSYTDVWNYIPSYCVDDNLDYFLNAANSAAANKSMAVFFIHKLTDDESKKDDSNTMYVGNYDTFLETISTYVNNGTAWNAFFEDAILYLQESASAKASVRLDGDIIYVTLTDEMSRSMLDENGNETGEEIYNYPLTVRIDVPETWKAIKYVQGGNIGYAEAKLVDGRWVADAEIIPDGGEATVTEAQLSDIPEPEEPQPVLGTEKAELNKTYDFENGITDVNANITDSSIASTSEKEIEGDTYLHISKTAASSTAKTSWTLYGGTEAVQATALSVSFDMIVDSASFEAGDYSNATSNKRLFNITFGSSTPFALVLYADIEASSDNQTAAVTKLYLSDANDGDYNDIDSLFELQFGQKYSIRIDVTMDGVNPLSANIYVNDVLATSTKASAGYTIGAVPNVEYVKFTAQGRAVFEVSLDDISIKTTAPTE